jgi:hypothetical protein
MRFARTTALFIALGLALPAAAAAQSAGPRPTNVRLTFHLIEADGEQRDDPEIQAVTTELRKLFRFQGYRLVQKSVLNATAWPHSNVQQKLTDDAGRSFMIHAKVELADANDVRLVVGLSMVDGGVLIDAAVNLQDGKTVVLGTTSGSFRGQGLLSALILAVTPTINP